MATGLRPRRCRPIGEPRLGSIPTARRRSASFLAVRLIVLGSIRYQPELFKTVQRQIDKMALVTLRE
jgi:hypothetical protein